MRNLVLFVIAVVASTPANASDWWLLNTVSNAPTRNVLFIDLAPSRQTGDFRDVWEALYFEMPIALFDNARLLKSLTRYDCKNSTSQPRYMVEYKADGTIIKSLSLTDTVAQPIIPDSAAEKNLRIVCVQDTSFQKSSAHLGSDPDFGKYSRFILSALDKATANP